MSRNVIDASLDTIPKTCQFFSVLLLCIEPTDQSKTIQKLNLLTSVPMPWLGVFKHLSHSKIESVSLQGTFFGETPYTLHINM